MKRANRNIMLILVTLAMIAISAIPVSAGFFPMPFSGKLEGPYVEGLTVQVTNTRTGDVQTTKTTYAGEWLIDWDRDTARTGDQFEIQVLDCDTASCKTTVTFNGEPEIYTVMKIYDADICKPCDTTDWTKVGVAAVIGLIIGLVAFMGGGLKIYKKRTGGIAALHRHKGIRDYHDINIQHTDVRYRHARFKDDPIKFAKDVAKIENEGGLI